MFIVDKVKRKIRNEIIHYSRSKRFYPYIYKSYWHKKITYKDNRIQKSSFYFTAQPNPGAGIGHQMANWIAGYWWAKQFGLNFAHLPFSTSQWDDFLGFGEKENKVSDLVKEGYKKIRIPLFNEFNQREVNRIKNIINSYSGKKVIFICEQDQGYKDQYGVIKDIQEKFYGAIARRNDQIIYYKENFNIAIHVRRGDIMNDPENPNLQMRYISNNYFKNVLEQVLTKLETNKPIHIYVFSQGKPEDFPEFQHYKNLHWCFNMDAQESFLHMVYADCLITSKSSFSYKPALLNKGIKVCPKEFWHSYPKCKDWILMENEGKTLIKISDE